MTASRLLKSCATPPASWPRLSSRCDCCSWRSSRSRSAWVLSRSRSACSSSRSVTSRTAADTRMPSPVSMADREISTGNVLPSRRRPASSIPEPICLGRGSARYAARCAGCPAWPASGSRISAGWPASSSRRYPNSRSVCAFTSTIRPPASTHTTASETVSSSPAIKRSANGMALTPDRPSQLKVKDNTRSVANWNPARDATGWPRFRQPRACPYAAQLGHCYHQPGYHQPGYHQPGDGRASGHETMPWGKYDARRQDMVDPPLPERTAWQALKRHYDDIAGVSLRELFAADPGRGERLTAEATGFFLDYSKNRVTGEAMRLLVALAGESGV